MSLKSSTIKKYKVEQLVKHLLKHSDLFMWVNNSLYIKRKSKEGDNESYFFYCLVTEYNKEKIVNLIETYT